MADPPADRCPYLRPFPNGFEECPAYQPNQYVGLSTHYEAMEPVWSCTNLQVAELPAGSHRHYARCRLGTAADREAWVAVIRGERLAALRRLGADLARMGGDLAARLVQAKGRQLAQRPASSDYDLATRELEALVREYLAAARVFFDEHADDLAVVGITPEATFGLIEEILVAYVPQRTAETPAVTEAMLARFPRDTWILFRPEIEGPAQR